MIKRPGHLCMIGDPLFSGLPIGTALDELLRKLVWANYDHLRASGGPVSRLQLRRTLAKVRLDEPLEIDWPSTPTGKMGQGHDQLGQAVFTRPFRGNPALWQLAPQRFVQKRCPVGRVVGQVLQLTVQFPAYQRDFVPVMYRDETDLISEYVCAQQADLALLRTTLPARVAQLVNEEWPKLTGAGDQP